jgi:hypothetical protein
MDGRLLTRTLRTGHALAGLVTILVVVIVPL